MPVQYTNRQGKTYYLHQGVTKTGKPRYHFSLKSEGSLVETIPKGFEVYENPNGRVYLRRIQPKVITDEEVAVVKRGIKRFSQLKHTLVDVKGKTIRVFTANQDVDGLAALLGFGAGDKDVQRTMAQFITYSPEMEFILVDEERRLFVVRRYCYLGSIDDWTEIDGPNDLEKMVREYIGHLGEDSFFELY